MRSPVATARSSRRLPGTTRDVLREHIQIDGLPLHIIDTAGLRDSNDAVEQEGIRRAWREIERADHVLFVVDSTSEQDADAILQQSFGGMRARLPAMSIVMNKCDLSGLAPGTVSDAATPTIAVSALTGAGMTALREHLKHAVGYRGNCGGEFSARRRHLDALDRTEAALRAGATQLGESLPPANSWPTEACLAAARMGCRTLLLTHSVDTLGQMSCNPAIGGIGKSQLVKEVDALGGAMARATDRAGIQFRVLNSRKGPAVRATRAQADRVLYKNAIRQMLESQPNLSIFQQPVDDLLIEHGRVAGAITQMGLTFRAPRVVLTTGTFLGGKIHIGLETSAGGRAGDPPSIALARRLRELPFRVERLKTGTPPRIDARSVDFSTLEQQWGDTPEPVMSFLGSAEEHPEQRCCWVTYTNEATHEVIRGGLDRSPLYYRRDRGRGSALLPQSSRTRFIALPTRAPTRYLSSPRA